MTYSIRQMAQELGISKSQVGRDAKEGMPMDSVEKARAWRAQHRDFTFAPNLMENDAIDCPSSITEDDPEPEASDAAEYKAARAERERIRMERERIELERIKGNVIDCAEAARMAFTIFRMIRDDILNVPTRIKDQVHAASSAFEVEQMIADELSAVFGRYNESDLLVEDSEDDDEDGS